MPNIQSFVQLQHGRLRRMPRSRIMSEGRKEKWRRWRKSTRTRYSWFPSRILCCLRFFFHESVFRMMRRGNWGWNCFKVLDPKTKMQKAGRRKRRTGDWRSCMGRLAQVVNEIWRIIENLLLYRQQAEGTSKRAKAKGTTSKTSGWRGGRGGGEGCWWWDQYASRPYWLAPHWGWTSFCRFVENPLIEYGCS